MIRGDSPTAATCIGTPQAVRRGVPMRETTQWGSERPMAQNEIRRAWPRALLPAVLEAGRVEMRHFQAGVESSGKPIHRR